MRIAIILLTVGVFALYTIYVFVFTSRNNTCPFCGKDNLAKFNETDNHVYFRCDEKDRHAARWGFRDSVSWKRGRSWTEKRNQLGE